MNETVSSVYVCASLSAYFGLLQIYCGRDGTKRGATQKKGCDTRSNSDRSSSSSSSSSTKNDQRGRLNFRRVGPNERRAQDEMRCCSAVDVADATNEASL